MPRRRETLLFVGIKGHVLALDSASGTERWRTKLEGVRMRTSGFVHLHRDADNLYAAYNGELFCLDPASGTLRWHNRLTGLGTGLASMLSDAPSRTESGPLTLFEEQRRQQQRQHGAAAGA